MIGFKFLNRMGSIQKSIKKLSKKNSLAITVLFVFLLLTKRVFFKKAYNSPTKR